MRICIVPPEGDPEYKDIDGSLDAMRAAIGGGYIERVNIQTRITEKMALVMVVDEDGLTKGLPLNLRASIYYPFNPIVGTVFFCGEARQSDGEIDFVGLPEDYEVVL